MASRRQLNIYVPDQGEALLERLRRLSERTGRPINRLVLDAISEYLQRHTPALPPFRTFDLGLKSSLKREDVYQKRLDRKVG